MSHSALLEHHYCQNNKGGARKQNAAPIKFIVLSLALLICTHTGPGECSADPLTHSRHSNDVPYALRPRRCTFNILQGVTHAVSLTYALPHQTRGTQKAHTGKGRLTTTEVQSVIHKYQNASTHLTGQSQKYHLFSQPTGQYISFLCRYTSSSIIVAIATASQSFNWIIFKLRIFIWFVLPSNFQKRFNLTSTALLFLLFWSNGWSFITCVLLLPEEVKKAERRDKGEWSSEPVSQAARPVQSTGTPAGKQSDSFHHGQGHHIFHRGDWKNTAAEETPNLKPNQYCIFSTEYNVSVLCCLCCIYSIQNHDKKK